MTDHDVSRAIWCKSSYSGGTGGNCVEIARNPPNVVAVRDSHDPHGPMLVFAASAWTAFTAAVKTGKFDMS